MRLTIFAFNAASVSDVGVGGHHNESSDPEASSGVVDKELSLSIPTAVQVFNELQGNTWSSLAKLRGCIGDVDGDADNALMEAEMKRQRGNTDTGEVRA